MKRKTCVIISLLAAAITVFNLAYIIRDSFFYSLDNLPVGTFIREDFSQNVLFSHGQKLKVYQIEETRNFPAAVRVELCNDNTGSCRTIYWQIGTQSTVISWSDISDTVVTINGVPIDFSETYYDCRDYANFTYSEKNSYFSAE